MHTTNKPKIVGKLSIHSVRPPRAKGWQMSWLFRKFNEPKPSEGPVKLWLRNLLENIVHLEIVTVMILLAVLSFLGFIVAALLTKWL